MRNSLTSRLLFFTVLNIQVFLLGICLFSALHPSVKEDTGQNFFLLEECVEYAKDLEKNGENEEEKCKEAEKDWIAVQYSQDILFLSSHSEKMTYREIPAGLSATLIEIAPQPPEQL